MTLSPERFHDLLDQGTADAPPAPPVFTDLEAGRTRLRQRRLASVAAGALALVVISGGIGLATRGASEDHGQDPISPPSQSSEPVPIPDPPVGISDAELLRDCSAGSLRQPYFDGAETVPVALVTAYQAVLAIESADGRYWAECTFDLGPPSERTGSGMSYDSQGTTQGYQSAVDAGCAPRSSACPFYAWSTVQRVSPQVAAVQVELTDGYTETVPAVRGYYVVNLLRPLPEGASVDERGLLLGLDSRNVVHRITYLDAAGTPIAAAALDGSGSGDGGFQVDDLPVAWDAYPSMKGEL